MYAKDLSRKVKSAKRQRALHTITTAYERDDLTRPASTILTDSSGVGYKQEISYAPKQWQEEIITPGTIAPGGAILPPIRETINHDDGTTNYIASVKTYAVNGETQTLEKTEDVDYDTNGNITKFGNNTYLLLEE